jgi:hypothetical protein
MIGPQFMGKREKGSIRPIKKMNHWVEDRDRITESTCGK